MSECVLVTGAGGFLGRAIVEQLLARGSRVRGLSRHEHSRLVAQGVTWFPADVREQSAVDAACHGVDAVIHTAALAGIWGSWRDYHGINTVGTENVIDACRRAGVTRLVFTSSPSVTFDGSPQEAVNESEPYPTRWLCHYPHSKALAEQRVLAANDSSGLRTCALRPHLIWGPGDPHLVPRLLHRARHGRLRRIGDGQNLIDTVYVDNAATAHLLALDALSVGSTVGGNAYFISQGAPVNCWDWINQLLALDGQAPVTRCLSLAAARRLGAVCEAVFRLWPGGAEPPMTRFVAAQLGTSHYFDIGRARRDLGYEPTVSAAEGMRRLGEAMAGGK